MKDSILILSIYIIIAMVIGYFFTTIGMTNALLGGILVTLIYIAYKLTEKNQ